MNLEKFIQHLESKDNKKKLENLVLKALQDSDFIKEYHNLNYLMNVHGHFQHICDDPMRYDNSSSDNYRHYQYFLVAVSNAFTTYLYDNKGKYADLKEIISEIEKRIEDAKHDLDEIQNLNEFISGEKVLQVYAEEFKIRADEYKKEADRWQIKLYWSFFVLGVVIISFLFVNIIDFSFLTKYLSEDIKDYGYFAIIFTKIILVIGLIQVTRFGYRNYNANKHLENQSLHKYDVLRALQGVYNTISNENKDARDELIKTGALTAFQTVESGYITTKEGAGSSDAGLYAAISGILKR